jgi:hypothetical protein
MHPIHVSDLVPEVGTVLQTVDDFVVVENVDAGKAAHCHARSIRTGRNVLVAFGSIRAVMIPVNHEVTESPTPVGPLTATVGPVEEQPVTDPVTTQLNAPKKTFEIVKGPAPQNKPKHIHHVSPPKPPQVTPPSITQEAKHENPVSDRGPATERKVDLGEDAAGADRQS